MPSTRSRGEPTLLFDQELNPTLRKMNDSYDSVNLGDGFNHQLPPPVDSNNKVIVENPDKGTLGRQPHAPRR